MGSAAATETGSTYEFSIRDATTADAPRMAELHADRISEGFLPTLGTSFLARLYRRVVLSGDGVCSVAVRPDGTVIGFCATVGDVGKLYKEFIRRDGLVAGAAAAPKIVRSWKRVLETLRYPAHAGDLPGAELIAVAVDAAASGHGVGRALVAVGLDAMGRSDVPAVKVVAGAHNEAAMALYLGAGFVLVDTMQVHNGVTSAVLVWNAPRPTDSPQGSNA